MEGVGLRVVIGGISRDVFFKWIIGVVASLIQGVVGSSVELLGFLPCPFLMLEILWWRW